MLCETGSICFELLKGLPAGFVALVVGAMAAFIAWRQYKTAKAKLKLDLFDKRYEVFKATWQHLSEMVQIGAGLSPIAKFDNLIPQARFLFGEKMETYLKEISSRRIDLWTIEQKTKASGDIIPPEEIENNRRLIEWFHSQASKGAVEVFGEWLDLSTWQ